MKIIIPVINLLFYSNFWIAACAAAMAWQTQLLLTGSLKNSPAIGLVFSATFFLYALHRTVGLFKVQAFTNKGRYKVIATFKHHIIVYTILTGIASIYFFFKVNALIQWSLVIPAGISLGYVIPFLSGKRRLRDLGNIKIFLVAAVWAWVTVFLPALEEGIFWNVAVWGMALERSLFIFAITLPFDIRDLKVDAHTKVSTIPAKIGILRTKQLAASILIIMSAISFCLFQMDIYTFANFVGLVISAVSTYSFIHFSDRIKHDYYFTGLLDGTMMIQFGLVYLFHYLISI